MVTWASIILALLRLVNLIMGAVNREKWIKAGEDAEIAKASAAILQKTRVGRAMMEKVDALDEAGVDAVLRGLEPK